MISKYRLHLFLLAKLSIYWTLRAIFVCAVFALINPTALQARTHTGQCEAYFKDISKDPDVDADLSLASATQNVSQNKIWSLKKQGNLLAAQAAENYALDTLLNGTVKKMVLLKKRFHTTDVYVVTFSNGVKAIFKPKISRFNSNPHYEVAAYVIDQLLGLDVVPVTSIRMINAQLGSIQLFVEGKNLHEIYLSFFERTKRFFRISPVVDLYSQKDPKIKFLDLILQTMDRSKFQFIASNIILTGEGFQAATDNGYSFLGYGTKDYREEFQLLEKNPTEFHPGRKAIETSRSRTLEDFRVLRRYIGDDWKSVFTALQHVLNIVDPL